MHEINETIRQTMTGLPESFEGTIVTTMPVPMRARMGRFDFRCVKFRPQHRAWVNLAYLAHALFLCSKAWIQGCRFDLVITYDPLRTGLVGWLAARLSAAKFAPELNGVYDSYANYLDLPPSLTARAKKWAYPRLVHFVLRRADGIKILFPEQLSSFKSLHARQVVSSFFAFVDLKAFKDIGEKKEVLFVGFPFWLKGVDILIQAFFKVADRYPEWTLKIMGWYPDSTELKRHMRGHPRIFHQPPVLHSQMHQHIGSCGILVLPSRTEAMGRVLLEAMAAGKPRIGAKVDGIPTVIEDGQDGFLFEPGNADDLASKLEQLMGDPSLRKKFGLRGQGRAAREFTPEAYFRQLSHFYDKVLST